MNIQQKLVSFPFLIGASSLIVFILSMMFVISNISNLLENEHPRLAAIYELEININEAATEVFIVSRTHVDQNQNQPLFEDAILDFKTNFDIYDASQTEADRFNEKTRLFEEKANNFIALGRNIFELNKLLVEDLNKLQALLSNHIDYLVDKEFQQSLVNTSVAQQDADQEIDINLYEIISAVRGYVLQPDSMFSDRIMDSTDDISHWISVYQSQPMTQQQQRYIHQLMVDMQRIEKLSHQVISLKDNIVKDLIQFQELYRQIDDLLDTNIQLEEQKRLDQQAVQINNILKYLTAFMILTICVTMLILYRATQPIIKNIKLLNQSSSVFSTSGEISLPKTQDDELGELADQMKRMMHSVNDTHQELKDAALHDPLTGLPNRALLFDRINRLISEQPRTNQLSAIVYLDLDEFKRVNDTFGHAVGDELLNQICQKVERLLRQADTLSRVGGDEFIIILPNQADRAQTRQVLNRILEAVVEPMDINGHAIQVSSSIGVTFLSIDNSVDADQLIQQADQAMYHAKNSGKNAICFFEDIGQQSK